MTLQQQSYNDRLEALARRSDYTPHGRLPGRAAQHLAFFCLRQIEIHCGRLYERTPVFADYELSPAERAGIPDTILVQLVDRDAPAKLLRFYKYGYLCSVGNRVYLTKDGWNWLTNQALIHQEEHPSRNTWAAQWLARKQAIRPKEIA